MPEALHDYSYGRDKWTIKQVLLHITDTERVMQYRALMAARGDNETPQSAMNENIFAQNAAVSNRSMQDLLAEFTIVRASTNCLLQNLTSEQTTWGIIANGHIITPRAIGYIIIGHVLHHINIINERYLKQ